MGCRSRRVTQPGRPGSVSATAVALARPRSRRGGQLNPV